MYLPSSIKNEYINLLFEVHKGTTYKCFVRRYEVAGAVLGTLAGVSFGYLISSMLDFSIAPSIGFGFLGLMFGQEKGIFDGQIKADKCIDDIVDGS